jgi:hypothetical protein
LIYRITAYTPHSISSGIVRAFIGTAWGLLRKFANKFPTCSGGAFVLLQLSSEHFSRPGMLITSKSIHHTIDTQHLTNFTENYRGVFSFTVVFYSNKKDGKLRPLPKQLTHFTFLTYLTSFLNFTA